MPIYIDSRGEGEAEIAKFLLKFHVPVEIRHIDSGDYVFNDIAIERKEVNDLLNSVYGDNRHFWEQLKTMKETYKKCIVLIEGQFPMEDKQCSGIFYAIVGGWNIPVIFTASRRESALCISKLFDRYGSGSQNRLPPAVVKKEMSNKNIKWAMVQCVQGIGGSLASKIIDAEPLVISTALNYVYIDRKLKEIGIPDKPRKRLLKVLFNED
jgi:ERCC4-type nuclease